MTTISYETRMKDLTSNCNASTKQHRVLSKMHLDANNKIIYIKKHETLWEEQKRVREVIGVNRMVTLF